MEFIEKFAKLKKKFEKITATGIGTDFAIQVNMTDEDCGGAFYIANIGGIFSVEPYDYVDHTAMITLTAADFEKLIGRKLELEKAIEEDKIAMEGNAEHIRLITELFPKPVKKTPAKKTAVKAEKAESKAAPKKTAAKKATAAKKTAAVKKDEK